MEHCSVEGRPSPNSLVPNLLVLATEIAEYRQELL